MYCFFLMELATYQQFSLLNLFVNIERIFVMLSAAKASVFQLKKSFPLAFLHIKILSLRSE
jgi:hypothetical protein